MVGISRIELLMSVYQTECLPLTYTPICEPSGIWTYSIAKLFLAKWSFLWQFEHNKIHLETSSFSFFSPTPLFGCSPMLKDLFVSSRWWKSKHEGCISEQSTQPPALTESIYLFFCAVYLARCLLKSNFLLGLEWYHFLWQANCLFLSL